MIHQHTLTHTQTQMSVATVIANSNFGWSVSSSHFPTNLCTVRFQCKQNSLSSSFLFFCRRICHSTSIWMLHIIQVLDLVYTNGLHMNLLYIHTTRTNGMNKRQDQPKKKYINCTFLLCRWAFVSYLVNIPNDLILSNPKGCKKYVMYLYKGLPPTTTRCWRGEKKGSAKNINI